MSVCFQLTGDVRNRSLILDTQDADANVSCTKSAGDIEADGKNDLIFSATLNGVGNEPGAAYVIWGQSVSDLLPTGGTLPLETSIDTGDGIAFIPDQPGFEEAFEVIGFPVGDLDDNNIAYAKDITNDGTADLLGSEFSQPLIVSGELILELAGDAGPQTEIDFSALFPGLCD